MPFSPVAKRSVETILALFLTLLSVPGLAGQSAARGVTQSGSSGTNWESLAACESSGRWHANTGNGYHGGLQIAPSTWRAYGGHRYASRPDLASRSEQIAVGERIVRDRGLSPWGTCGRRSTVGSWHTRVGTSHRRSSAPHGPARRFHKESGGHTYVVRQGDCLSVIANRTGVPGGTKALYELNRGTLRQGADHIYPGQRLRLRA